MCEHLVSTTSKGCPYSDALDTSGEVVEVNEVLHNALVIAHVEIVKVGLCFALGVMQSKVIS